MVMVAAKSLTFCRLACMTMTSITTSAFGLSRSCDQLLRQRDLVRRIAHDDRAQSIISECRRISATERTAVAISCSSWTVVALGT